MGSQLSDKKGLYFGKSPLFSELIYSKHCLENTLCSILY